MGNAVAECRKMVGATGIEPVTPAVSRQEAAEMFLMRLKHFQRNQRLPAPLFYVRQPNGTEQGRNIPPEMGTSWAAGGGFPSARGKVRCRIRSRFLECQGRIKEAAKMAALHLYRPFAGQYVIGQQDGDIIQGGATSDYLIGHKGLDIFTFDQGGGRDYVVGFEGGVDKLDVGGSIRQISWKDTPQGIEVYYGQFGQSGPDHFLLVGVHSLDASDFIFS